LITGGCIPFFLPLAETVFAFAGFFFEDLYECIAFSMAFGWVVFGWLGEV